MTELITSLDETFNFNGKCIRVLGEYNNPWFVAKDICEILDIKDNRSALRVIPDKWKGEQIMPTPGGKQALSIISEPAVYKLIMRSNKEIAQKFQEVVCEDILPSIRRTGEFKLQEMLDKKEKELKDTRHQLYNEQKDKKNLLNTQLKFSQRHKFSEEPCIYVLENPDDKFGKYKIGMTDNINERLTSDRCMIPSLKVRLILYTYHYQLFEKILKIKYKDDFELPSHEWLFYELDKLVKEIDEIDKVCAFISRKESELWRINLEEPPKLDQQEKKYEIDKEFYCRKKNLPISRDDPSQIEAILPTYLPRYEYVNKNNDAPKNMRYCNSFCQEFRLLTQFNKVSLSYSTVCRNCEELEAMAEIKIKNGDLTPKDIRGNPSILLLKKDEKLCGKCNKIKGIEEFPEKRRQCKSCRNSVRSKFGKDFDKQVEKEVEKLKEIKTKTELNDKLNVYVKDELQKILQFIGVSRRYNDTKQIVKEKIFNHYVNNFNLI